jgi:hypothetical protein
VSLKSLFYTAAAWGGPHFALPTAFLFDHLMPKILTGDYLFQTPSGEPSPYFTALTVGFALLFLVCVFLYFRRNRLAGNKPPLTRFYRRVAKTGMWIAGIGLFLALMRYVQFPFLGMPVLMYVLLLSMIGIAGYFVYDWSERYPLALQRVEEGHVQRRYRSTPRQRVARPIRPRTTRGKRRR